MDSTSKVCEIKWVPVMQSLPDYGRPVLLCTGCGTVQFSAYELYYNENTAEDGYSQIGHEWICLANDSIDAIDLNQPCFWAYLPEGAIDV